MELSQEFKIKVTAIEPGMVDTNLREDITDKELLKIRITEKTNLN